MAKPIITPEEIERIAELGSLELSREEKERLVKQFEDILNYFKKIDEAPLPELHDHPQDDSDHLRDDVVVKSEVSPRQFSPYLEREHFKVPKVIE